MASAFSFDFLGDDIDDLENTGTSVHANGTIEDGNDTGARLVPSDRTGSRNAATTVDDGENERVEAKSHSLEEWVGFPLCSLL
jgi:hypothetical protein